MNHETMFDVHHANMNQNGNYGKLLLHEDTNRLETLCEHRSENLCLPAL